MKLSITPISLARTIRSGQLDLPGMMEWAKNNDFDAVDLLSPTIYPWLWKDFSREIGRVRGWASDLGLELAAFGCGNNFAKSDKAEFDAHCRQVIEATEYAAELGIRNIRIFGGHLDHPKIGGEKGMTAAVGLKRVMEGIERCLPYAEKNNVVLAIENHCALPGYSWEIRAIIEKFNSPHLRSTFDVANFMGPNMPEAEDPLRAYECLRKYIAFVHLKDVGRPIHDFNKHSEACMLGEGYVPLRQLLVRLVEDGYSGYYSIEYECGSRMNELEGLPKWVKTFRDIEEHINSINLAA